MLETVVRDEPAKTYHGNKKSCVQCTAKVTEGGCWNYPSALKNDSRWWPKQLSGVALINAWLQIRMQLLIQSQCNSLTSRPQVSVLETMSLRASLHQSVKEWQVSTKEAEAKTDTDEPIQANQANRTKILPCSKGSVEYYWFVLSLREETRHPECWHRRASSPVWDLPDHYTHEKRSENSTWE